MTQKAISFICYNIDMIKNCHCLIACKKKRENKEKKCILYTFIPLHHLLYQRCILKLQLQNFKFKTFKFIFFVFCVVSFYQMSISTYYSHNAQ